MWAQRPAAGWVALALGWLGWKHFALAGRGGSRDRFDPGACAADPGRGAQAFAQHHGDARSQWRIAIQLSPACIEAVFTGEAD